MTQSQSQQLHTIVEIPLDEGFGGPSAPPPLPSRTALLTGLLHSLPQLVRSDDDVTGSSTNTGTGTRPAVAFPRENPRGENRHVTTDEYPSPATASGGGGDSTGNEVPNGEGGGGGGGGGGNGADVEAERENDSMDEAISLNCPFDLNDLHDLHDCGPPPPPLPLLPS